MSEDIAKIFLGELTKERRCVMEIWTAVAEEICDRCNPEYIEEKYGKIKRDVKKIWVKEYE